MQQINLLLTSLPDGILLGFVYGLAAMGLTLIWGVMNVINLSHGPIIALGMFGTFFLFNKLGLNPYTGLIPIAVFGLLLGILIYTVAVHRVINAPHLSSLLATFSVNMIIIGLGTAAFTTLQRGLYCGKFQTRLNHIAWHAVNRRVRHYAVYRRLVSLSLPNSTWQIHPGRSKQSGCSRIDGCTLHENTGVKLWFGNNARRCFRCLDRNLFSF
jgi:branched-subunit amino acid ABC-type transport system permease component